MMIRSFQKVRKRIHRLVRLSGWDIVRYRPAPLAAPPSWPTLLGAANLPIRTVLDIGAKDGDTARIFRRYFPNAIIHCFEPHPRSFAALTTWATQQEPAVYCHPYALGNSIGAAPLYVSGARLAVASLLPLGAWQQGNPVFMAELTTLPVEVRRLDDVAATLTLNDDLLVKIDTEGFDTQVILGGMAVLRRAAACIVEVHLLPRYVAQPTFREIIELLAAADFAYAGTLHQGRKATGGLTHFDALFIKQALL